MTEELGLAYIGKVIEMSAIEGADFIVCATVECGKGGKWKGVVRKNDIILGQLCTVYLPDAVIQPNESMKFLESSKWRVHMRRFKGAPSEVVIMPLEITQDDLEVGTDCTNLLKVTKYYKPVPDNLQGKAKGSFPCFIPKTDESNYQKVPEMITSLVGKPYYITEKADGSSTTAFKYKGKFGICSRNWELERDVDNGYWKVAIRHNLEQHLPEGYALQWETCGPKIQNNPLGFHEVTGLAFSAYNISENRYLELCEFLEFCHKLNFPIVHICDFGEKFSDENIDLLGEGTYSNGKQREGVVVRSTENYYGNKPISFKVINLNYEDSK